MSQCYTFIWNAWKQKNHEKCFSIRWNVLWETGKGFEQMNENDTHLFQIMQDVKIGSVSFSEVINTVIVEA